VTALVLVAAGIVIGRLWGWLRCGAEAEAHQARRETKALRRAGEAEMAAIAHNDQNRRNGVAPRHAAPRN
jgi:hypothetical protein